ncbi:hypothetical protein B7494_g4281 [Chlorociboria aeruginascens]|nr:hypothetical protein B7494_g4281 [Chlorociboria aeruginascens]
MPFPFTLPTTSSFSFSTYFSSDSHPSLPLSASTYRGVLRDALKKHKRLSSAEQSSNLSSILLSLNNYIPYLLAVDAGLGRQSIAGEELDTVLKSTPILEWRPTISEPSIPGRESARLKFQSLEYEIFFVLSTLAYTYTLLSRTSLHPLYSTAGASPSPEARTTAITAATKHLLAAARIHSYLSTRSESLSTPLPCIDIANPTFRALTSLALAEATLLAVLKDDPYPAAVAQDRNKNDKEWMIKPPEIPKVRAHLFARLCLATAEHAANASSLLNASPGRPQGKIDADLLKYVNDLRRSGRGKACRFFGIAAELGGETGTGIAWLQAGFNELGLAKGKEEKKGLGFGRFKKGWDEKREDRRVERESAWGADAGRLEEGRVLEMLETKWNKINDTINTQAIPPFGALLANIPSSREIHTLQPFRPPELEPQLLETMRAPPDRSDDPMEDDDSEDETVVNDPTPLRSQTHVTHIYEHDPRSSTTQKRSSSQLNPRTNRNPPQLIIWLRDPVHLQTLRRHSACVPAELQRTRARILTGERMSIGTGIDDQRRIEWRRQRGTMQQTVQITDVSWKGGGRRDVIDKSGFDPLNLKGRARRGAEHSIACGQRIACLGLSSCHI